MKIKKKYSMGNIVRQLFGEKVYYLIFFIFKNLKIKKSKSQVLLKLKEYLCYNEKQNQFNFYNEKLAKEDRFYVRKKIILKLRDVLPTTSVSLDTIKTGFYDRCLERYLFERIDKGFENEDTCWFSRASNNHCLGWIDPEIGFGKDKKIEFVSLLNKRKPLFNDISIIDFFERDAKGYVYLKSSVVYTKDYKILLLLEKLQKNQFSNIQSSATPIILGFSTTTSTYNVLSGRHRVACLKYLRNRGKISSPLKIWCHVVSYPFESLVYTRPYYKNRLCSRCLNEFEDGFW
jgi:hypothetical protein